MATQPRYRFRARRFGIGSGLPLAWQGALAFFLYLLSAVAAVVFLTPVRYGVGVLLAVLAGLTLVFVVGARVLGG